MTQDDLLLAWLREGRTITPAQADENWRMLALHSAISRLRKRGCLIECKIRVKNGRRWGEYRIFPVEDIPHFELPTEQRELVV